MVRFRTARVFQVGTQRRNLPHFAFACELARTGKLGKLKRVYAHPRGMLAITSIYVRYLLPMMCEIQWWDYHDPSPVADPGAITVKGNA